MLLTASYISRQKLAICGTPSAIIMVRLNEELCAGGSFLTFPSELPQQLKVGIQPIKKKAVE